MKGVTVRVDEEIYDQLDEISDCIGYPKNEQAPIQYTINFLLKFALQELGELARPHQVKI